MTTMETRFRQELAAEQTRRTMQQLVAQQLTEQVTMLWPTLSDDQRARLRRQTTVDGLKMAIADLRRART